LSHWAFVQSSPAAPHDRVLTADLDDLHRSNRYYIDKPVQSFFGGSLIGGSLVGGSLIGGLGSSSFGGGLGGSSALLDV
jgi:predicted lipid-binding transport protein (Tim44 family)